MATTTKSLFSINSLSFMMVMVVPTPFLALHHRLVEVYFKSRALPYRGVPWHQDSSVWSQRADSHS
eukprot:6424683-Amphidinium_carterae.1